MQETEVGGNVRDSYKNIAYGWGRWRQSFRERNHEQKQERERHV